MYYHIVISNPGVMKVFEWKNWKEGNAVGTALKFCSRKVDLWGGAITDPSAWGKMDIYSTEDQLPDDLGMNKYGSPITILDYLINLEQQGTNVKIVTKDIFDQAKKLMQEEENSEK